MSHKDIKSNYSVEVTYSVSTPLYNRVINRDGKNNEESIVVVDQPETLTNMVLSTEPQNRDAEEIKYSSGNKTVQADYEEVDLDKEIEEASYGSTGPTYNTEVNGLEGEYIRPTMDDIMGE